MLATACRYLDRVLKNIVVPISSCTENEARRYGRFLSDTFQLVGHWHGDKSVFDAECANTPGFKTQLRRGDKDNKDGGGGGMDSGYVQYEDYRDAAYVWHRRVTKAFVFLLESKDFVLMRNSIIILTQLLPHFPKLRRFGTALTQRIEAVREQAKEESMEDLKTMALTYMGRLKLHKNELVTDVSCVSCDTDTRTQPRKPAHYPFEHYNATHTAPRQHHANISNTRSHIANTHPPSL